MDIKGKVTKIMPVVTGTRERTGETWESQDFVLEYSENPNDTRIVDSVVLRLRTEKLAELSDLKEGDILNVSIGHTAREYNGRWFNNVVLYKVVREVGGATDSGAPEPDPFGKGDPLDDTHTIF